MNMSPMRIKVTSTIEKAICVLMFPFLFLLSMAVMLLAILNSTRIRRIPGMPVRKSCYLGSCQWFITGLGNHMDRSSYCTIVKDPLGSIGLKPDAPVGADRTQSVICTNSKIFIVVV